MIAAPIITVVAIKTENPGKNDSSAVGGATQLPISKQLSSTRMVLFI